MTAVARIAIQDCPMLLGDLLLSGPPLPGVTASVPTVDDLSAAFPRGSSIVPRELCQKVAVLSETFVVGWAGGYDTARAVIGELRRIEMAQRFTNDSCGDTSTASARPSGRRAIRPASASTGLRQNASRPSTELRYRV